MFLPCALVQTRFSLPRSAQGEILARMDEMQAELDGCPLPDEAGAGVE